MSTRLRHGTNATKYLWVTFDHESEEVEAFSSRWRQPEWRQVVANGAHYWQQWNGREWVHGETLCSSALRELGLVNLDNIPIGQARLVAVTVE